MYHFYLGDPIELLQLYPDGNGKLFKIGSRLKKDMTPQLLVPKNVWQGSRLIKDGEFALLGTTMDIAYDPSDFENADRAQLIRAYPAFEKIITSLTNYLYKLCFGAF